MGSSGGGSSTPSDVFNSPVPRPRNFNENGIGVINGEQLQGEAFTGELEHLPVLSALREKVSAEADAVMDKAVQLSLNVRKIKFRIP